MVAQKIIVVVEDVDAARSALRWAVRNLLRHDDLITLIHVFPSSRSRNRQKQRRRRLNGFQLALSFKELCVGVPEAKVEIVVTEGDQEATIVSLVREIGASTLVIGIHDKSFLFKSDTALNWINDLNCRVFAVKQPTAGIDNSATTDFSQIEIVRPWKKAPVITFYGDQEEERQGHERKSAPLIHFTGSGSGSGSDEGRWGHLLALI